MTVHVEFLGGKQKKIRSMGDSDLVEFAEGASFKDWEPSFIRLALKPNVVIGQGRFSPLAFQHAKIVVDITNGTLKGSLSLGREGQAVAVRSTDFVPNDLGQRIAYIPDTEYNRNVLAKTLEFGAQWVIKDKAVLAEVKAVSDRVVKVHEYLSKQAHEQATKKVEASKAALVKGLKETYADGYAQTQEYISNVKNDIDREETLIFSQLRKPGYDNIVLPGEGKEQADKTPAPVDAPTAPTETPQVIVDQLNGKIPTLEEVNAMNNADLKALVGKLGLDAKLNIGKDKLASAVAVHYELVPLPTEEQD